MRKEVGTRTLLEAVAKEKSFSLVCGGDTGVAIDRLNIDKKRFSYVSVAGGALITYLSGNPMPGLASLEK